MNSQSVHKAASLTCYKEPAKPAVHWWAALLVTSEICIRSEFHNFQSALAVLETSKDADKWIKNCRDGLKKAEAAEAKANEPN